MTTSTKMTERKRLFGFGAVLTAIALLILIGFGYCASRLSSVSLLGSRGGTTITNDIVVQQVKAVAKLV